MDLDPVISSALDLSPLPQSAARLAGLFADEDWSLGDVTEVVRLDQALAARILRLANSTAGGSRTEIVNVDAAVMRAGPGTTLAMVLATGVKDEMRAALDAYQLEEGALWRHSVASALAIEEVQGVGGHRPPVEAFAATLLHDVGKLVLARFLDEETVEFLNRAHGEGGQDVTSAEIEILEVHHGEIGGLIGDHWKLPRAIVDGIRYHHDPESAPSPQARELCWFVALADACAASVNAPDGDPEDEATWCEAMESATGVGLAAFEELGRRVEDRLDDVLARYE